MQESKYVLVEGYKVFSDGHIEHNGCMLKGYVTKKGYVRIRIHKRQIFVHRLVAEAFLGKPLPNQQVNHKNGIKTDNRVENLEWCSASENLKHSYDKLGRKAAFKGKHLPDYVKVKLSAANKGKKRSPEVVLKNSISHIGIGLLGKNPNAKPVICVNTGKRFSCIKEAAQSIGCNANALATAIRKNRTIYNYKFVKEEKI